MARRRKYKLTTNHLARTALSLKQAKINDQLTMKEQIAALSESLNLQKDSNVKTTSTAFFASTLHGFAVVLPARVYQDIGIELGSKNIYCTIVDMGMKVIESL